MTNKLIISSLVALTLLVAVPTVVAQEDGGGQSPAFCGNENSQNAEVHPMAAAIAARFETDLSEIMDLFCNGDGETDGRYGFGQIIMSYQTAKANRGGSPRALLVRQREGNGWGQVWQEEGLIGRPEDAVPPGHANRPANAGQKGGPGGEKGGPGGPKGGNQTEALDEGECPPEQDAEQSNGGGKGKGKGNSESPECEVELELESDTVEPEVETDTNESETTE